MKLADLVGKRVELTRETNWCARTSPVPVGKMGTVVLTRISPKVELVHIDFDRMKPSGGFLFGMGFALDDFDERKQAHYRILD